MIGSSDQFESTQTYATRPLCGLSAPVVRANCAHCPGTWRGQTTGLIYAANGCAERGPWDSISFAALFPVIFFPLGRLGSARPARFGFARTARSPRAGEPSPPRLPGKDRPPRHRRAKYRRAAGDAPCERSCGKRSQKGPGRGGFHLVTPRAGAQTRGKAPKVSAPPP